MPFEAELALPDTGFLVEVLVGLGVDEKPLPEALRELLRPEARHLGEPVASR